MSYGPPLQLRCFDQDTLMNAIWCASAAWLESLPSKSLPSSYAHLHMASKLNRFSTQPTSNAPRNHDVMLPLEAISWATLSVNTLCAYKHHNDPNRKVRLILANSGAFHWLQRFWVSVNYDRLISTILSIWYDSKRQKIKHWTDQIILSLWSDFFQLFLLWKN